MRGATFRVKGMRGGSPFCAVLTLGALLMFRSKQQSQNQKKKQGQQERELLKWNEKAPYYISNNNHTEMRKKGNI